MIMIKPEELCAMVQTFAHEVSDDSGDVLRGDWHVMNFLETVDAIAKRTDGLSDKLRQDAGLFCLTFEDVYRRRIGR